MSCEDVRSYVQMYGASVVRAYAKSVGATPQQIREGRACLDRRRSALKKRIGRMSAAPGITTSSRADAGAVGLDR
jgi:hypothetical protein